MGERRVGTPLASHPMLVARRIGLSLVALALFAGACGADSTFPSDAFAIRANMDLGLGKDRLLIGIGAEDGTRLGSADDAVTVRVAPVDEPAAEQSAPGLWTEIIPEVSGLYRATFDFDRPGTWLATVVPEDGDPMEPVPFLVAEDPWTPALGEQAPVAATPTLDDLPLERLTTDPTPDVAFYETSLDDAIASGLPTVLVFSTPAYCQTAACGPLLDNVQEVMPQYPDVNFVHVEVFTEFWTDGFTPTAEYIAPSAGPDGYNLPSEPWVFVIDAGGVIVGRFEGAMASAELAPLLG